MSENNQNVNLASFAQALQQISNSKVLMAVIPQLFTSGEMIKDGKTDNVLLAVIGNKAELMALAYVNYRGERCSAARKFLDFYLRGTPAVGGLARKQGSEIGQALGGGNRGKVFTRRTWWQRNVSERGKGEFKEQDVE